MVKNERQALRDYERAGAKDDFYAALVSIAAARGKMLRCGLRKP